MTLSSFPLSLFPSLLPLSHPTLSHSPTHLCPPPPLLSLHRELLGYLTEEQLTTLEKALCSSEGLGSLQLTPPNTQQDKTTPTAAPRPLSSTTIPSPLVGEMSSEPPQSNPVTPDPQRRDVPRRNSSSSHQRSRSLGSHDLMIRALNATSDQAGLDLPPQSTTACGGAATPTPEAAATDLPSCEVTPATPSSREVESFPQFGPDQPIANDLPMASPIISPHLLATQDSKHTPSSSSSPSTKRKESGKPTRRSGQRNKGPAGFASADDLMHRLFVAISGVADQLQTNHAKDLRVILKHVFAVCQSEPEESDTDSTASEKNEDGQEFLMQSSPTLSPSLSSVEGSSY